MSTKTVCRVVSRRSLLMSAGMAGLALLPQGGAWGEGNGLTHGDIDILRFLAAAELFETDLWQQYNELASGNPAFKEALENIDDDNPDYIEQNTDNEESHAEFINAFLVSRGAEPVNLDAFRTLPSSQATGAQQIGRLTNLRHLTVDTSWYNKYLSEGNPDLGNTFPQVVDIVNR